MTPISFLSLVPALLGLFAVQPGVAQSVTRLVSDDEMILRVPVQPRRMVPRESAAGEVSGEILAE